MIELLIVAALIVLNGFFAMSELALMTSRKLRLRQMAEEKGPAARGARCALAMAEHPDDLLSTVQVGITLIGIMAGVFGGEAIGQLIADHVGSAWPVTDMHAEVFGVSYAHAIGITVAVALITAGQVIFGELVPKRLALTNPERIAAAVALPLHAISRAARPVVRALAAINRATLRLLRVGGGERSTVSEEEIRLLVLESHEQGVIDEDERRMMNRVLSLGDRTAEGLMTPRTRIAWLDAAASREENIAVMQASPFSRFPVYRENDQDVLGILEVKSLLRPLASGEVPDLFAELREAVFVSESTPALKLLEIYRAEQQSLVLVVDEYGDVTGLVTVNDLMDAVVGRVQSTDRDGGKPGVTVRDDGSMLIDGALGVEELRELVGDADLPGEEEHDFHTAAGMVIAHYGRIPNVGEHFSWDGWRIEVIDLDGPRVDKLLLQAVPDSEDADDARTS